MKYNFIRFPGGRAKAVTFSYDDGSKSDVKLVETVDKYGIKCTFNLVGDSVAAEKGITKAFIKERMIGGGHEIAVHGYYHRGQDVLRPIEGIRDVLDCRLALESEFGMIIRGMAYPDRCPNRFKIPDTYARIRTYLEELDIAYARTVGDDNDRFELPEDFLDWFPTAHHDNPKVMEYIEKFVSMDMSKLYIAQRSAKLFFLWGHSAEFERNGNWEHLEAICQKLSGHGDVWYATNMEIYEYVTAYRSLKWSADGSMVYNPTLYEIWFDIDRTLYQIKPGETLKIS